MIDELRPIEAPECERALLGCYLLDEKSLELHPVRVDQLYRETSRIVMRAIIALRQRGVAVCTQTVFDHLHQDGRIGGAGGLQVADVIGLANAAVSAALAGDYRKIVVEAADKRRLKALSLELDADSSDPTRSPTSAISRTRAALDQIGEAADSVASSSVALAGLKMVRDLANPEANFRVRLGLRELDEITNGGLMPRQVTVLAGRPAAGKTTTALQAVINVASSGRPVIWFGREMPDDQTGVKLLECVAGVPIFTASQDQLLANMATIESASEHISGLPVEFDFRSRTIEEICAKGRRIARRMQMEHGCPPLIVLDYIQRVEREAPTGIGHIDVGFVSWMFLELVKDTRSAGILISMLKRPPETKKAKPPTMGELKQSGDIEQDAGLIVLMHRVGAEDGQALAVIPKHRFGKTGEISFVFDGARSRVS